ncbi:MAG: sulfotransferase [Rubrobacter sp.]
MNIVEAVERIRDYREKNGKVDRVIAVWMANPLVGTAVRKSVIYAAERSLAREQESAPGTYESVFFVAGEMRSGTSWLRRTLSAHPQIACSHEGSFFGLDYDHEDIPVYKGPVSSLTRPFTLATRDFRTWHDMPWNQWSGDFDEDMRNIVRRSIDYFLEKEVARTGKAIVGDKSPQHTENLDEIHAYYPDARIIHIVRDGRDVAVSAMNHWWRLAQDQPEAAFELDAEELENRDAYRADREGYLAAGRSIFTEERLAQLARRWSLRTQKARRDGTELYGERYLEIRYEDFLSDGGNTLARLLDFLGARSNEQVVGRCLRASSFETASNRSQGEEDPSSFFRKGVAGDWKSVFTSRDRELYESVAGEQLTASGYEVDGEVSEKVGDGA